MIFRRLLNLLRALGDACVWLVMGIGFWLMLLTGGFDEELKDERDHDEDFPPPE